MAWSSRATRHSSFTTHFYVILLPPRNIIKKSAKSPPHARNEHVNIYQHINNIVHMRRTSHASPTAWWGTGVGLAGRSVGLILGTDGVYTMAGLVRVEIGSPMTLKGARFQIVIHVIIHWFQIVIHVIIHWFQIRLSNGFNFCVPLHRGGVVSKLNSFEPWIERRPVSKS